jgi:hypothetical protein
MFLKRINRIDRGGIKEMSRDRLFKNLFYGIESLFDISGKASIQKPKYRSQRKGMLAFREMNVNSHYTPPQYDFMNLIIDSENVACDFNRAINKLNHGQKNKK